MKLSKYLWNQLESPAINCPFERSAPRWPHYFHWSNLGLSAVARSPLALALASSFPVLVPVTTVEYWEAALDWQNFVEYSFEIESMSRLSKNTAEIRWVATYVTVDGSAFGLPVSSEYPFGQTYVVHNLADTVEVDDYCKILKRDFNDTDYDDDEWKAMTSAVQDVMCAIDESDCIEDSSGASTWTSAFTWAPTGAPTGSA